MTAETPAPFDDADLRRATQARFFRRGLGVFEDGAVRWMELQDRAATGTVRGTRDYRVALRVSAKGVISPSCTCPVGEDGLFCKHAVALGLAWIEGGKRRRKGAASSPVPPPPLATAEDLRRYLEGRTQAELIAWILDRAESDEELHQQLVLDVARVRPVASARESWFAMVEAIADPGGYLDEWESSDFADGLDRLADSLAERIGDDAETAAAVVELCEFALTRIEEGMEMVDDSLGSVCQSLERFQVVHLRACRKARPEPAALARRLLDRELQSSWDVFYGAFERYAGVLGKEGRAAYAEAATAAWRKLPPLEPDGRSRTRTRVGTRAEHPHRHRLSSILVALADRAGDLDARIDVMSQDLSSPWCFLKIAEACRDGERPEQAREWAERGLAAFPDSEPHWDILIFLAAWHQRRKQPERALARLWQGFAADPRLDRYCVLREFARRARCWTAWKEKALAHLRRQARHRADLIRILLHEKQAGAAWKEAGKVGCPDELWLELARAREKGHPLDVVPIYRREVVRAISRKNVDGYRLAVTHLRRIRKLLRAAGRGQDFAPYLEEVRAEHKLKRNLMAMLGRARW